MPKKPLFAFKPKYLLLCVFIFCIEVLIAKYMHDQVIRPFGGDVLVVVLIYAFIRSFLNINYKKISLKFFPVSSAEKTIHPG